ncbi:M61 family metallopeptidase [Muriicola sp. Z0-33]|uniref:M61 family metallopeptidase n=1 Tax=Muriicola sp. Z0-33 TaxID=2816957 RepID=UPI0022370E63|nr:PDZ domain-containing protein [Muriicola sp. Z0-33]MCW5514952.1 M61 family metallopeptidase [Muriicola sp. Z0-33]
MQRPFLKLIFLICPIILTAQSSSYNISFDNAVHHEAEITILFSEVEKDTLIVQMSRSSPGRYAIHEFAKNVYNFKATDEEGNSLNVFRPDPSKWGITGHKGVVKIGYTLFANRGDGTYSQVDETHAHLNMPATFMFAPQLSNGKHKVQFNPRNDLNWKIATQLVLEEGTTYTAPNLQYFMDSPTEISDFGLRSFEVDSEDATYTIQLALHHNGTEEELNDYFESVKKVVLAEKEVFGELPEFDNGTYTFLACYIPNASGDGMEHRNSTVLTSTRSLGNGGLTRNIGTVSHEFFHAWNVERIRPTSLEPFDFTTSNMSGELWFAEGFTSYYTGLILCRAGLRTAEQYVEGLKGTFNYVWNSPARKFFNPIEMSYQAPFVDAATSVDPVNRANTFISYYSYGSVLGLALDLSLREQGLNLDDYMRLIWTTFGKNETPYTIEDLHKSLNKYAGEAFGNNFFNNFIYQSKMPDYNSLFATVGVKLIRHSETPYFGASLSVKDDGSGHILSSTRIGSPAYVAGLEKGDIIKTINGQAFQKDQSFTDLIKTFKIGDTLEVVYERFGEAHTSTVKLGPGKQYSIELQEKNGDTPSAEILKNRNAWLKMK